MEKLISAELRAVSRETLKDGVADSLRAAIFDQTLRPGQRIPESQIATKLGVSRAPVRDALAVLSQEGLVHRDDRGARVAHLTRSDVDEIATLRLALERLAVELVVRNGTPEDFDDLEVIASQTAIAGSSDEASELDLRFHDRMVQATRHTRLIRAWCGLRSQVLLLLVHLDEEFVELPRLTAAAHMQFLELLREGDEPKAIELLEHHLETTHRLVAKHYDSTARDHNAAAIDSTV